MGFEVNDNQQFVAKENGPIELDKRVTPKERIALENALEGDKDTILADTEGNLARLLHEDIIPHISDFNPEVQEDLLALAEKHPESVSNVSLSPEMQEYFQIGSSEDSELAQNLEQLSKLGLDLDQFLAGLQTHIDEELTFLSSDAKAKICRSIGLKTLALGGVLDDMDLQNFSGEELLNQRWIVNTKIQEAYSFYTQSLFPSLELHNAIRSGKEVSTDFTDKKEIRTLENGTTYEAANQKYVDIDMHMEEIDELLAASIDDEGNFDEGFFSTQEILSTTNERHEALLEDMGISSSEDISLLSEEDKKIEGKAMLCYLAAVGLQCVPYLGAALSLPADVKDVFSSEDSTLQALQATPLIDSNYRMEKTGLDRVISGVSVIFTAVGFQALAKTGKIMKAVTKITGLSPTEVTSIFGEFTQHMGLSDEVGSALSKFLGLSHSNEIGDTLSEAANLNRAPSGNPEQQTVVTGKPERMDIPEQLAANGTDGMPSQRFNREEMMQNASRDIDSRIQESARILGIELNSSQQTRIREVHEMFSQGSGTYTLRELGQKRMKAMEEGGFTKEQATLLMDKGLLGYSDRLMNLPQLRSFQQGDQLGVGSDIYIKWSDGNSYPAKVESWTETHYIVTLGDGRNVEVEPRGIQIIDESQNSNTPVGQVAGDIWGVQNENLPPINTQDVSNLFADLSGQSIYRELNTLIVDADITTGAGRQALRSKLLGTLKRDVDTLGVRIESSTTSIESNRSTLGHLEQSIQEQTTALSRLQEEQTSLIVRRTELESQIAQNRSGMSETQREVLIDLEKSWDNLSHHAESVRAYATLKNLGGYEKGGDIPTELRHVKQELARAEIQKVSHELIKTPGQRALDSYNSIRNGKIEAAKDIIRGDIEHYNQVLINKFPGKEIGDLNLDQLRQLAASDITQNMRLDQHSGIDLGPNTVEDTSKLQEKFRGALGEVGEFEGQKASFLTQQTQEAQGTYSRELAQALTQTPITQENIVRLEQRIQALETLGSIGSQTLSNIVEFHDVYGGEAKLSELRDMRNQVDGVSTGSVAELDNINNSIGDISGRIESNTVTLSAEETRRSGLANDIATRENENMRSQEWRDYYTGLGRQVVTMFP